MTVSKRWGRDLGRTFVGIWVGECSLASMSVVETLPHPLRVLPPPLLAPHSPPPRALSFIFSAQQSQSGPCPPPLPLPPLPSVEKQSSPLLLSSLALGMPTLFIYLRTFARPVFHVRSCPQDSCYLLSLTDRSLLDLSVLFLMRPDHPFPSLSHASSSVSLIFLLSPTLV